MTLFFFVTDLQISKGKIKSKTDCRILRTEDKHHYKSSRLGARDQVASHSFVMAARAQHTGSLV